MTLYNAGSRRGQSRPTPSMLAIREHTRRACAALVMAAAVVLAHCSVVGRRREIVDSELVLSKPPGADMCAA